jgi:Sulfotransferase domain
MNTNLIGPFAGSAFMDPDFRQDDGTGPLRIAMWSGPRNLSTALMRSFGNRADTFVSDEPYYGAFLKTSGAEHPMREAVIAAMDCDWRRIARTISGPAPDGSPVWYQKHMWHHMVGPVGYEDFTGFTHAFLIRLPELMIGSYLRKRESAAFEDFGLDRQAEFFEREADRLGEAPPVVDANDILADPEGTLTALCRRLGIPFDPAMLAWPPGRRATDGPWAPHWYQAVEASTGFGPPEPAPADLPGDARRLAERCRPYYERLAAHKITACS